MVCGRCEALPYTKHSDAITPACSSMHTYDHAPTKLEWEPMDLTEMSCGDWKFWKIHQKCNNGFWLLPHKESGRRNKLRTLGIQLIWHGFSYTKFCRYIDIGENSFPQRSTVYFNMTYLLRDSLNLAGFKEDAFPSLTLFFF
jgi:hypothetical protein